MKLFQQMLVAPAALGLLATGVNAAELNINGVSDYAASADQVTSVTQFSDVYPTDWAYQALAGLVETYGCVAGYPNGTFRGNRAMTRYEAAALLNACLDRVTEVTDELRRLMAEFETELAILKGRVDGLEAKVGELEATQFSTTTKLKGKSTFILGAVDFEGNPSTRGALVHGEALTAQYDTRIGLKTSFTGKDLLFTRLRVANMDNEVFAEGLTKLDTAGPAGDQLTLDRLYYKFPVGDSLTVIAGPMARNTESLGMKPTAYKTKVLNFFGGQWGTSGVHNKETGALAGLIWKQKVAKGEPGFTAAANYLIEEEHSSVSNGDAGGILGRQGGNYTAQIGYGNKKWGGALAYRYGQCSAGGGVGYDDGAVRCVLNNDRYSQNYALNGFWKPSESGVIPAISAGYGWTSVENGNADFDTQSWMVGLTWKDVFDTDHTFNFGFGTPSYRTDAGFQYPGVSWEASMKMKVTNNITVVPALFYLPEKVQGRANDSVFGGVLQTVFKF